MILQKIILCVAVGLAAFGFSLGLLEVGSYLRTAFQPLKTEIKPPQPLASPVVYPERIPDFKPPAYEPAEESEPAEELEDWGATGNYYIIGENPKGFEDVEWMQIITHEYSEKLEKVVAVKPYGFLQSDKKFTFSWLSLTGKRISFVTRTRKDISFQFDGKLIEAEEVEYKINGEVMTDTAVLKGRLTKWRNGVKIAEAKVKLAMTHGC